MVAVDRHSRGLLELAMTQAETAVAIAYQHSYIQEELLELEPALAAVELLRIDCFPHIWVERLETAV